MTDTQRLIDDSDLRRYRHELPNMVDDLGLSPYAYRLYGHIKRRAGAGAGGECFEGARRMAEHCKMSLGMIVKAKKELEAAGLIRIQPGDPKTSTPDTITIVNIWAKNLRLYQTCSPDEQPVHRVNTPVHGQPETRSDSEHPCSPGERKNEPTEERTSEEVAAPAPASVASDPFESEPVKLYVKLMRPEPGLSIHQATLVETEVGRMDIWRNVLVLFSGNEHRGKDGTGRQVGYALDRYRKEVDKANAEQSAQPATGPSAPKPFSCPNCKNTGEVTRMNPQTREDERIPCSCLTRLTTSTGAQQRPAMTR